MEKWLKLKKFIEDIEPDVEKYYSKEFDLTGGRVTVGMQQLKIMAQEVRKDILMMRNRNRKIKKAKKGR